MKKFNGQSSGRGLVSFRHLLSIALGALPMLGATLGWAQGIQPVVAVHDSELTRALETMPAVSPTPTGPGTTGFQWWPTDWHYFVMPDSVKEALRADGTAFTVIGTITSRRGWCSPMVSRNIPSWSASLPKRFAMTRLPRSRITWRRVVICWWVPRPSHRFPDGTGRGDFAIGAQMGLHVTTAGPLNWSANTTFTKQGNHRLLTHVPDGQLTWRIASTAEEVSWGISPIHNFLAPHDVWQVQAADATFIAQGDATPYLAVEPYGRGCFIYCSAFQPLIGHGGFAPGMYSYVILRKAIEWAFEASNVPMPRLSPWPYAYDAAFMVRHDLENYQDEIAGVEASAQFEASHGAKGDYYFCTGTLREEMAATGTIPMM